VPLYWFHKSATVRFSFRRSAPQSLGSRPIIARQCKWTKRVGGRIGHHLP
jgi:hypothetical protein